MTISYSHVCALGTAVVGMAILAGSGAAQVTTFHHCTLVNSSGNTPHLFDVSETYHCDEGIIKLAGRRTMTIEYDYVYTEELGRLGGDRPRPATAYDYENFKWCPTPKPRDPNQMEMCGDKPHICFDGKMATWDKDWKGYSCATPDHQEKEHSK